MKHVLPLFLIASLATPVVADDAPMADLLKRFGELSDNAQTLLKSWADELGPKLEELGPALENLATKLGDLNAYHPPEVLENGDIIIRRKTPLPKAEPVPAPEDKKIIDL